MLTRRFWLPLMLVVVALTMAPTGGQVQAIPASQGEIVFELAARSGSFVDEIREHCRSGKKRCAEQFFTQQGTQVIYMNTQGSCARFKFRTGGIRFYGGGDFTGPEYHDGSGPYKTRCVHYAEFTRLQEGLPAST